MTSPSPVLQPDFSIDVMNAMLKSGSYHEAKQLFIHCLKRLLSTSPELACSWAARTLPEIKNADAAYISELVRAVFFALKRRGEVNRACQFHSLLVSTILDKRPSHDLRAALSICTSLIASAVDKDSHRDAKRQLQESGLRLMTEAIEGLDRQSDITAELFQRRCELVREKAKLLMVLGMTVKEEGRFQECADLSMKVVKQLLSDIAKSEQGLIKAGVPRRLISIEKLQTVARQLALKSDRYHYARSQLMSSAKSLVGEFDLCLAYISNNCLKEPPPTADIADIIAALRLEARQGDRMAISALFSLGDLLRVRSVQWSELGQHKKAVSDLEWSLRCLADEEAPLGSVGRGLNQRLLATLAELAVAQQHVNLPKSVYIGHVVQREVEGIALYNEAMPAVDKALRLLGRRSKKVFLDSLSGSPHGNGARTMGRSVELKITDESGNPLAGEDLWALERSKRHERVLAARVERLRFEASELDHFGLHITLGKLGDSLAEIGKDSSLLPAMDEVEALVEEFVKSHMPNGLKRLKLIDWQPTTLVRRRLALYEAAALIAEQFAPADALDHLDKMADLLEETDEAEAFLKVRIRHFTLCKKVKHCLWGANSAIAISEGYRQLSKTQASVQFALDGLSLLREGLDYLFLREDLRKYLTTASRIQTQLLALVLNSKSYESVSYDRLFAEVDATQARILEHSARLADQPEMLALDTELGDDLLEDEERSQTIQEVISSQLASADQIHLPGLGSSVVGYAHDTPGILKSLRSQAKGWLDTNRLFLRYFWDGNQMWVLPLRFSDGDPPPYICYEPRPLQCEPVEIQAAVELYDKKTSRCLEDDIDLKEGLERLWGWLISPVADLLKQNRLVVVLSDEIRGVPFHSLLNKDRFLIQDRLVSYSPNLSAISGNDQARNAPSLVIGLDATIDAETDAAGVAAALREASPDRVVLRPSSGDECVGALLSNREYDFVYITGHGYVSNSRLRSELLVGGQLITHRHWMQWGPTARIIFFNICHVAGDSRILPGEHEGFMAASFVRGTRFCLAADREIESTDAIHFGRAFVTALAHGVDPVLASAQAMRSAIGGKPATVPLRVWTPYFVYGVA